jgi:caa(3)-type oxidase subunit IV
MSGSTEEVKKHIAVYWKVFGGLMVLTTLTVAVSYLSVAVPVAIGIALIIASVKGSMVASFFMHLTGERKMIFWALAVTAAFWVFLMSLPLLGQWDQLGVPKTLPNADAAAMHAEEEL